MKEDTENRLDRIFDFIREADKEKNIFRRTLIADGTRHENDAEHAWHMALMAVLLGEYASEHVDMAKTLSLIIVHDLAEIYAGDTFAYDSEGIKTQEKRENEAAEKLFSMLPDDLRDKLEALRIEFDENKTPEARFAKAMDNIQPVMLNDVTGGKMWREKEIKLSQVMKRNRNTHLGSEVLWDYTFKKIIEPNAFSGNLIDDRLPKEITYIKEPTDLQCGQAVLAMLTGMEVSTICGLLDNEKETTLKEMKKVLDMFSIRYNSERKEAFSKADLPECCILSLETPRCWHWSLYFKGTFYDPEHGVMKDFPQTERKYYWEIFINEQ